MSGTESRQVPIRRESRTLEQQHNDMVTRLRSPRGDIQAAHRHRFASDWLDDVNRWADWVHGGWNNEMRRLFDCALPLVPVDLFGPSPHDVFAPYGDVWTVLNRMDRQMEAMRRTMDQKMDARHQHALDYLNTAYELGEGGQPYFKLRFNLQGYSPEDIEVKSSKHGLSVNAKKSVQSDKGSYSQSYSRTVYLPDSVDEKQLECRLSEDGILTAEAPLIPECQKAIKLGRDSQLGIKPKSDSSDKSLALQPLNKPGLSIVTAEDNRQKLHLELELEPDFTADDVCVRVDGNRVMVSGKKETIDETPNSKSSHVKEFTRSYQIPETADTLAVNAQMVGTKLLVEAPLLKQPAMK